MKKYFDIQETVKYNHRIEIEVDESQEELFEEFAEDIARDMESGVYDCKEQILDEFLVGYGKEAVEFTEDGSPLVEYESY